MAVKKMVDTWKSKSWYSVIAPKFLNEVEVAQIPSLDDEHVLNRIIKIPMKDITKDLSHVYTTIKLRVSEIKGKTAFAKYIGHEVSREYIHAMVRRKTDALNVVFRSKSKDGVDFTIKAVVLTGTSCSGAQKTELRNRLEKLLRQKVKSTDFGKFIYDTLFGRTAAEAFKSLKGVAPIKRVEIRKTELYEVFDTDEKFGEEGKAEEEKGGAAAKEGKEKEKAEKSAGEGQTDEPAEEEETGEPEEESEEPAEEGEEGESASETPAPARA